MISSTLNDADRMTLEEKFSLLKEKHHRLSDNLTQRLNLLDEANRMLNILFKKIFSTDSSRRTR